jgi:hypothetical protein
MLVQDAGPKINQELILQNYDWSLVNGELQRHEIVCNAVGRRKS